MSVSLVEKFSFEVGDRIQTPDGMPGEVMSFLQSGEQGFLIRSYNVMTLGGPYKGTRIVMSEMIEDARFAAVTGRRSRFDLTE